MSRRKAIIRVPLALLLLLLFSVPFSAQEAYDVRANYEKSEYQIPMRDGVKLFTVVYSPRDKSKKYPILLNRTPYSVGP